MAKLVQAIRVPPQSGKTTAAAALMRGYADIGVHAAYIAPTEYCASSTAERYGFARANAYGWSSRLVTEGKLDRYQAIILDDVESMQSPEGDPLLLLADRYAARVVPFPSIFAFYAVRPRVDDGRAVSGLAWKVHAHQGGDRAAA
ncbi:hypothetical protein WT88_29515 [Burkholderia stagnalis]|uniref:AAA family ATPase n=2 Tax=Burkholderia stagnalis TaxID=1503054 RepID=UPI00075C041E|nr:AAA family ATPase [Burkholderia stagnalis]KVZ18622.1 hypothetical protein WT35_04455 [Burkholderia stagnalis]KWN32845.1 hypothetical protein WT86_18580 [Burkholderia stagnalis]KWN44672.1 hypothetical protein WT88_29515 [Burkholderia stagnalis]KWN54405.1 hypothetical protein WT87_03610 [Burkholderia stagnalis]KWO68812.1 hypothetical protein WT99_20980 [Burkholderia stagnalis]